MSIYCLVILFLYITIYFRFTFMLSMWLDYLKANFNHCLSSGFKSTLTSIYGLSCGFDVVSSFIILCWKLRHGKTIGSGKRNSTISGIKERGLSTDTGRKELRDSEDNHDELERACHHLITDGQKFWYRLMKQLFESEKSGAERHTW